MSTRKRTRRDHSAHNEMESALEEARAMFSDNLENPGIDHKTAQLCGQVAEAIGYALACECRDSLLSGLAVASVEPAPSPRRLRVTVYPSVWADDYDPGTVLARLARATGFLRSEVAEAIHRKRTPELVFEVVHPDEVDV